MRTRDDMPMYRHPYGISVHGMPFPNDRRWFRIDEFFLASDGKPHCERVFCTGSDDNSRQHLQITSGDPYDGHNCASCFLGHPHTVRAHNAAAAPNKQAQE